MYDNTIESAEESLRLAELDVRADLGDYADDVDYWADLVVGIACQFPNDVANELMDRHLGFRLALPGRA